MVMMLAGGVLIYLAIAKDYEPVLLLPIGFGAILTNLPLTGIADDMGCLPSCTGPASRRSSSPCSSSSAWVP
jgi:Na+-transporting methylmalonyl-CoA/oxaloacetate decarboxylase beta subunit